MTSQLTDSGPAERPDGAAEPNETPPAPLATGRSRPTIGLGPRDLRAQGIHHGVRFHVEALRRDDLFEGHFTIEDEVLPGHNRTGGDDSYRPSTANRWATPAEALTYATEAAHHAIEGIRPFFTSGPSPGM